MAALISQIHKYLSPLKPNSNGDVSPQPIVRLTAGDVLFHQGDPSDAVYITYMLLEFKRHAFVTRLS
ncbi:cyclic nucleotide-binding domain-containing protein, partial [Candidatus Entotheonella palauensis]|uniref:cyclic nucleotide-binding domain-containing protein n=1 Tax=Candidatus Entotheonella palauensis TaxID=93172 RepID=UPI001C4DFE18